MENRIIVHIKKAGDKYSGVIRCNGSEYDSGIMDIRPDDRIDLNNGKSIAIKEMLDALMDNNAGEYGPSFDERMQIATGKYLYRQIFDKNDKNFPNGIDFENFHIQIITEEEHVTHIPWVLLAKQNGAYLTSSGACVSIGVHENRRDISLPSCPKLLVIAPEPKDWGETRAGNHIEKLEDMLREAHRDYNTGGGLKIVRTWEEFKDAVLDFELHAIYFYGHGQGDRDKTHLIFTTGRSHKAKPVSASDIAHVIKQSGNIPYIMYLNCCYGDSGGLFGAGQALSRAGVPAVLTNRTIAMIDAAMSQGILFWQNIISDGMAPHKAVANLYKDLIGGDVSLSDARWMTPVLYCHYDKWTSKPPPKINRLVDPHWQIKLDRINQFGRVSYLTRSMLKEGRPKILVYLWYGEEGQGIDIFHHRLSVELRDEVERACFVEKQPEWPPFVDPNTSFNDMICEAFESESPDHIPACIRQCSKGRANRPVLLYIRHTPLRTLKIINIKVIRQYLEWLDTYFVKLLGKNAYAVVGISYIVKKPAKFAEMVKKKIIREIKLKKTAFHLLNELEKITEIHLRDFIRDHDIKLLESSIDNIIEYVIDNSKGKYEHVLELLKDAVSRPCDFIDKNPETDKDDEEEDFGVDD